MVAICTVVFILIINVAESQANVVGAFILPHGGLALDPRNFNTTNQTEKYEAYEINNACRRVAQDIQQLQPDIVVLSTPHGLADDNNFLIYSNLKAAGYGLVDDCLIQPCQYNISVELDAGLAALLYTGSGSTENLSLLTGFGPAGNDNEIPIRWGEVIPMLFVSNMSNVRYVVLSQPTRRYVQSVAMIPELTKLGGTIFRMLDKQQERVVVVISADLAHTHKADGPYGYSNASQPFDDAIGRWANELDATSLLDTAAGLVDRALSCGYTGIVMLNGMMSQIGLSSWNSAVYANLHPSYYGMMAATFLRNSDKLELRK